MLQQWPEGGWGPHGKLIQSARATPAVNRAEIFKRDIVRTSADAEQTRQDKIEDMGQHSGCLIHQSKQARTSENMPMSKGMVRKTAESIARGNKMP